MKIAVRTDNLITAIASVARAADDDDVQHANRFGVHLRVAGGVLNVEAANGHWLARAQHTAEVAYADGAAAMLVKRPAVKPLVAWLKSRAKAATRTLIDLATGEFDGCGERYVIVPGHDAYPPVDAVVDIATRERVADVDAIGVHAAYLVDALASARDAAGKDANVVLAFGGALDPVLVTATHAPEWLAVVMPVRR